MISFLGKTESLRERLNRAEALQIETRKVCDEISRQRDASINRAVVAERKLTDLENAIATEKAIVAEMEATLRRERDERASEVAELKKELSEYSIEVTSAHESIAAMGDASAALADINKQISLAGFSDFPSLLAFALEFDSVAKSLETLCESIEEMRTELRRASGPPPSASLADDGQAPADANPVGASLEPVPIVEEYKE
jgi:chromosome segregation ATPase